MTTPPSHPDPTPPLPLGHVRVPALAIGVLSLTLALGLHLTGIIPLLNSVINRLLNGPSSSTQPPQAAIWAGTILLPFGLAFAILSVPGTWRRAILWISTLAVVSAWAPVLILASRSPEVAAPLVAVAWAGFCALIYAGRHQMVAAQSPESPTNATDLS